MLVDPDFFDHWRTRMLVDLLDGDELAPLYVQRIWAHCQNRRDDTFQMPASGLKALCRFTGDAGDLEAALSESGFLERDGTTLIVPKWMEHNASLTKNWQNGKKGGRPPKSPQQNPTETQEEPSGNPEETQEEPNPNLGSHVETDKKGRDRKGVEGNKKRAPSPAAPSPEWREATAAVAEHLGDYRTAVDDAAQLVDPPYVLACVEYHRSAGAAHKPQHLHTRLRQSHPSKPPDDPDTWLKREPLSGADQRAMDLLERVSDAGVEQNRGVDEIEQHFRKSAAKNKHGPKAIERAVFEWRYPSRRKP